MKATITPTKLPAPELVTVEFFGIPRQRAGRAELLVANGTIRETLLAIEQACPKLHGILLPDDRVSPQYLLSINGREFVSDMQKTLDPGDHFLLLSADAGG